MVVFYTDFSRGLAPFSKNNNNKKEILKVKNRSKKGHYR
jgi:hypothetical protein